MNKENYSVVMLNDFLLNAGVVGFLRLVSFANAYDEPCRKGEDYVIDGQRLYISKDFLMNRDIGDLFVRAMVHYLGPDTKYERVLGQKPVLDALCAQPKPDDKKWVKDTDELFNSFADMLLKNSFLSGYAILSNRDGISVPNVGIIAAIKKSKDYSEKKNYYNQVYQLLSQKDVREILTFKDILYTTVNMFYADNQGNGAAFLSKREIEPSQAFDIYFLEPLRASINAGKSKNMLTCISCGNPVEKENAISITKFVDTADDMGKKKSYYWNCNPDAYLCPMCALICALAPLGFTYLGSDGVFINNNSDVETLWSFANTIEESKSGEDGNVWYKLYNTFTSEKIANLAQKTNNIQVVIREKNTGRYSLNMVDKATVSLFDRCQAQFESLKKIYVKYQGEFINVYQETVKNVLNKRNQYLLMTELIHAALDSGEQRLGYVFGILNIQIAQKGGENVEANVKRAYVAKMEGTELRSKLTTDLAEADKDNKLRGLVYQMLNAVSLGNREKFMELVLRTYSGAGLPVPDIFFSCFNSDEEFKEIGFVYLLGLKSEHSKIEESAEK